MRRRLNRSARGWSAGAGILLFLFVGIFAERATAQGRDVLVFAAASLKNALDDVNAEYQRQTGRKVTVSYASSPTLAKQIEAAAPADVFMSADLDWMDYLAQRRLIKPETRRKLLANRLVLVSPGKTPGETPGETRWGGETYRGGLGGAVGAPQSNSVNKAQPDVTISHGFPLANLLGSGRLAMADPDSVPAGKYGKAALEHLGVWASVRTRIARAENVRAALALVSRGEAPLGIVYQTDAAADPKVKVVGFFPEDSHPPITYPVAAVAASTAPTTAAYLEFLRSPAAKPYFEKQGFTVLK
ncbi:MAG TPA: molybdate ABC transporter substrate-binding protein [Candidatus Acidoferrum sp.]|nr:molybdate ABC transporter substrate-binding protein [Candidatus Acidoferrum sp.]